MAATPRGVAAIVAIILGLAPLSLATLGLTALGLATAGAGHAGDDARVLASELRIALGDVDRLAEPDLPPAHRTGLTERLAGALGLLPWLLQRAGDEDGARALSHFQETSLEPPAETEPLATLLAELSSRHPLDLADSAAPAVTATATREARVIHQTYCAGCHDGAENGDPALTLPARDLLLMGRTERPDIFVARLFNGIKGDETIGFRNPLTDDQLTALRTFYSDE